MSIDYGFKIRLSLLNMSRCIPDLQRRQALGCEGKSAVGGRIETHKLSISALKDAMHICCLHIDLIRIVVLVQEIILLHVSLSIESTEKKSLAHAFSSETASRDLEDVWRLRFKRGTSTVAHHLKHVSKAVLAGSLEGCQ